MGWVVALYEYSGSTDTELSFQEGAVIETISDDAVDDWLEGFLDGKQGFFPANYVEPCDPPSAKAIPAAAPAPVQAAAAPAPAAAPQAKSSHAQAKVLYDFAGEEEIELTVQEGMTVDIISIDEGDGWWKVQHSGQQGLVPESYLEPLPDSASAPAAAAAAAPPPSADPAANGPGPDMYAGAEEEPQPYDDVFAEVDNRLSIMNLTGLPQEKFTITNYKWDEHEPTYHVELQETEKKKKYGGMKSFVAYGVVTPDKNLTVQRRFKHFDWLRQQLVEKFPMIAVPPLPSKQYGGRFEQDFIDMRRKDLELFLNRCSNHPVLRSCATFQHFLMAVDESTWKKGKRIAEKDPQKGSYFFRNVQPAQAPIKEADAEIARFKTDLKSLEKQLTRADAANEKLHVASNNYAQVAQHYGEMIDAISKGCEGPDSALCWRLDCPVADDFRLVLGQTGAQYTGLSEKLQGKVNAARDELARLFRDYIAIIPTLYDILKVRDSAMYTYMTAYSKSVKAGRAMTQEEERNLSNMKNRCDVITNIMLSEMEHFHTMRARDFKDHFATFMEFHASLHQEMADAWKQLADATRSNKM